MNPNDVHPSYPILDPPIRNPDHSHGSATPALGKPAHTEDDLALLGRMAAGDESSLGVLFDRYGSRAHSLALHIVGDDDEAEDIVEDAFWKAWRMASRYESSRGSVATWVLMIARSLALDCLRARHRRTVGNAVEREVRGSLGRSGGEESPLEQVVGWLREDAVARVLTELPDEQRRVIELAFYHGLSHSEIAQHTGEPLGTIKTRVRLAMIKLRERLGNLREESL